jgi:ketosteroid isomerase-like protein
MSQENVAAVRAIYRSWAKGDFSSAAWADPDILFVLSGPDWRVHRGLQAVRRAGGQWLQAWDEFRVEAGEFTDVGDAVLVLTEFRGRSKASGLSVESMTGAHVFWLRDGKVCVLASRCRPVGR